MRTRRLSLLLLATALVSCASTTASAGAAEPIENVWSFNGGEVAISGASGTVTGTVVAPTKFTQCFHPAGQRMWTEMRLQPDGSYWGLHSWYFNTPECVLNPQPGLTAWRVFPNPTGGDFLRVCFSEPGSTSQPTIAPDGSVSGATFGCSNSALVSPLPTVSQPEAAKYLQLPSAATCLARTKLKLRLVEPASDPFAKVVATLRSGKVQRRAKLTHEKGVTLASFNLGGLVTRTFKVKIQATTVLGATLTRKRTFGRCRGAGAGHKRHRHSYSRS